MSNLSDLKAALETAAAELTDDIEKYECLSDIDEWYDCRTALAAFTGHDVQSYTTPAGRQVTRKNLPQLERSERALYARIKNHLYGTSAVLLDNRTDGVRV